MDDLSAEMSRFDPPPSEKRKDALISLYYVAVFLLCGLPAWYLTTTTYRATLPASDIAQFASSKIAIAIKVNIINFDGRVDMDELFVLQDKLLERLNNASAADERAFVVLKHTGFVRHASKEEHKAYQSARALADLDKMSADFDNNAIHILALPHESPLWPSSMTTAIIRSKIDRNVALLRWRSVDAALRSIGDIVSRLMARSDDLNLVYRAALDVPEKESLNEIPAHVRPFLSRTRTAPKYEWAFSLIVPHPRGGPLPEWDFPRMEHLYLEPLMRKLAPFVAVRVSSQLLYQVRLERIWPSVPVRGDRRVRAYSREALTHVNGIEPYLGGSSSALHFVSYIASLADDRETHQTRHYLRLEEGSRYGGPDAFVVPRWGGLAIWNNASVPLDGGAVMAVFLPQIRALMGLARRSDSSAAPREIEEEPLDASGVAHWQLHAWLRERTVENLAIAQVTLQSILVLLDRVANIVIRDDVAGHVRTATSLARNSLDALNSLADRNALQIAFLSSKQALEAAETAFFHPSLLELLYFQDDQKIGIYIPLFVPVVIPVLLAALKVRPFLKAAFLKAKTD